MSTVYELKATLRGSSPSIYRIFKVNAKTPLQILHEVMQGMFGWENFHRHFYKNSKGVKIQKADNKLLSEIIEKNDHFTYVYDLGNAWTIDIFLLQEHENESFIDCPVCIGGGRKSPPEESGGIVGYQMAIEMLSKKDNRENDLLFEWYGESYNPDYFNLDEINQRLMYLRYEEAINQ